MNNNLIKLMQKDEKLVIGLMSGTSLDGTDAAIVRICGNGMDTKAELIDYFCVPFSETVKRRIFELFDGEITSKELCHMNFFLGEIFAAAAIEVVKHAKMNMEDIDLICSHGQTIYHIPEPILDSGYSVRSTLQIGEGAVIARRTGVITVSDFRVMDMAAGGQGAPLVPYADFLLYRQNDATVGLQNVGGIGNITVLPTGCSSEDVIAFDTGPGNMIIDEFVRLYSNGSLEYDKGGAIAGRGKVNCDMLREFMSHEYIYRGYPKTTGRELFGRDYARATYMKWSNKGVSAFDMIATATMFTASSIEYACSKTVNMHIDELILGGGGAWNRTLLSDLAALMPNTKVITQSDIGCNIDAKEAIAFAILGNETIEGNTNDLRAVTGASFSQIMGKISLI